MKDALRIISTSRPTPNTIVIKVQDKKDIIYTGILKPVSNMDRGFSDKICEVCGRPLKDDRYTICYECNRDKNEYGFLK